jgi:chromate transporter
MAIITIAAVKLVKLTDRRDWRLWVITVTVFGLTAATGSEPILVILGAGMLMIGLDARPKMRRPRRRSTPVDPEQGSSGEPPQRSAAFPFVVPAAAFGAIAGGGTLVALGLFFLKTGAIVSTVAIFTPIYLGVVVPGRWFLRHRDNPQIKAFVSGATAAAAGALSGAVVVLTRQAVTDWATVAIALVTLAVLWRFKVGEPYVVLAAGALGILIH